MGSTECSHQNGRAQNQAVTRDGARQLPLPPLTPPYCVSFRSGASKASRHRSSSTRGSPALSWHCPQSPSGMSSPLSMRTIGPTSAPSAWRLRGKAAKIFLPHERYNFDDNGCRILEPWALSQNVASFPLNPYRAQTRTRPSPYATGCKMSRHPVMNRGQTFVGLRGRGWHTLWTPPGTKEGNRRVRHKACPRLLNNVWQWRTLR